MQKPNYGETKVTGNDGCTKSEREVNEEKFKNGLFYNNDDSDCIGVLWPLIEILISPPKPPKEGK